MIKTIVFILLFIVTAVLLFDFVPDFLNWFRRIKIGRITDDGEWKKSVKAVNTGWMLKGAPDVPKNEHRRLKLIQLIKNFKSGSTTAYWQDAALLKGMSDPRENNDERKAAEKLIEKYIDIFTGEWENRPDKVDSAILAYEILCSGCIDSKTAEPAMTYIAEMLKAQYDSFGSVPYNTDIPDIRFVDTVGMICPFLIRYAAEYSHPEYIDIAVKQIAQYKKYGFDEKMKLPYHCFNEKTEAQLGICGWGRGCGWWMTGIADSLKELLKIDGFDKEKAMLLKLNISFADELKKYITDGPVNRMLLNDSLPDSSASAMAAYCYAYLYRLTKKQEYREITERIFGYLKSATRRNGVIDFSQGDTMGIGYYSSTFSVVPAAQGFTAAALNLLD